MKEINLRKPWWRFVSVMLSLVMTITLLSGCGPATGKENSQQAKSNIESTEIKEEKLSKETQENIHGTNRVLVESNETVETLLNQLEEQLQEDSVNLAADSIQTLEDALAKTEKQTNEWLAAQKKAGEELSEGTATLLAERNAAFEKEIAEKEQQAETLLSDLKEALNNENTQEAEKLASELENLLVEEQEPKTYGDTLPGEATVYEPEVVELDSEEADNTSESVTVSEEALSDLLVTKEDTELNEELIQLTNELGTPLAVYNYLKNNIGYEYYYGSRKGAAGTYAALGGNDIDQASLLIAMLRHLGIEAQYVRGTIHLDEEQATALTGADTISHAADVLAAAGTPVTKLTLDGEVVAIAMEHVWVRAHVPYTDYRGAGNAAGERVWIDFDTSIKAYEEVENLYDILDEEGFSEEAKQVVGAGDIAAMETLLDTWESEISSRELENVYARKRIIKQEELSYLPLSLQYTVAEELETFAHTDREDKDAISFLVGGESLGTYTSSELAGKDILLSFHPVSDEDAEILNSYDSIFDVPAHSVYLKPVLLINGEVVAEGEDIGATLGTSQTFTMTLHSGGKDTVVDNPVTTGSMYAVTLDNQSITGEELQRVYDEAAALKDTVTENNVYSEAYLGKLLALAGKLYFAQIDIADIMAADVYGVSSVRVLSEGITGYEAKTTSLYGVVTGLSEGNLYIDIDTDSHNVISLTGDEDASKEYMIATGMLSSAYEGIIWEEITKCEGVSTMSLLAKAQEEGVEILTLSKSNLDTEIEKLHTDEATKQTVINAVNSGKIVTIPANDITMDDWHGTGYIITNPETGAGAYMITGGLNGGSSPIEVGTAFITNTICSVVDLVEAMSSLCAAIKTMACSVTMVGGIAGVAVAAISMACMMLTLNNMTNTFMTMFEYLNGDLEAGEELIDEAGWNLVLTIGINAGGFAAKKALQGILKSDLIRTIGTDCTEKLLKQFGDVKELSKYVKRILKMGIAPGVIIEVSEKFGREGLEWLISKQGMGLTDDLVRKMLKADSLGVFTDSVVYAIKNSDGHVDDIIEQVVKYGDEAAKIIVQYGEDAVKALVQYGEVALNALAKYGQDAVDIFVVYGDEAVEFIKLYDNVATEALIKYGDEALEVLTDYGDEAAEGFKNGKTPDEIRATYGKVTSATQYARLVDGRIEVKGSYPDSYTASQVLREELYAAGVSKPPYKNAAHHIVLWNDPRAADAREILESYGIHYNSAVNGVLLPMETNAYTGNAALHMGNHSLEYVEYVTDKLQDVVDAGGSIDDIVAALNKIRKELLEGTISLN